MKVDIFPASEETLSMVSSVIISNSNGSVVTLVTKERVDKGKRVDGLNLKVYIIEKKGPVRKGVSVEVIVVKGSKVITLGPHLIYGRLSSTIIVSLHGTDQAADVFLFSLH